MNPRWWQKRLPVYGNWGGIGWSAGRWNNDPALTDWGVPAIDAMDELFKAHDEVYQNGGNRDEADRKLVRDLKRIRPAAFRGKWFRLLAMASFTVWPKIRSFWRKFT